MKIIFSNRKNDISLLNNNVAQALYRLKALMF